MKQFIFLLGVIFVSLYSNAQTELWGMTLYGGLYDGGTIFKTDNLGSDESVEYNFFLNEGYGSDKAKLTQALDGNFYGLTTSNSSYGILFQYNPVTNIYTRKINFNTIISGQYPCGSLLQASDGKLYGMTSMGGLSNCGILFQYDPISNILTKKVDFASCGLNKPSGSLMQASDGRLYGMTNLGGVNNLGALFQYDPVTNVCIKKIDFDGLTNGSKPNGNLIQATNGKLYGLTPSGGSNGDGVLFQYDINSNVFIKKHDFLVSTNGEYPMGGLCQATDGKLYGMTNSGGTNGLGTLFQYDPVSNSLNKKNDFSGVLDGSLPNTSLMQASDGFLYGTTSEGGSNNLGTLFQYDINTFSINKKIDFDGVVFGKSPRCELMQANDGKLYGSTILGGTGNNGVLFQYNINTSTLIKKIDFGASEGEYPYSSLIKASDGNLYGMTRFGGLYGVGTVFKYDPQTHNYNKRYNFNFDSILGYYPECSLMEASDGKLYGMTQFGGLYGAGTLFYFDPILDTIIKKYDFDVTNGKQPIGTLIQASNGKLYGTTYTGSGVNSGGTLFQFDISTNIFTKKVDFASYGSGGSQPMGALVQASNGKLYGMTEFGGIAPANLGVLFEYDPNTNVFAKKIDFTGTLNGANPYGSLVLASDGKLYGMTGWGGASNGGVLFQYDFNTNTLIKKIDFNGTNGFRPSGSLLVNSNGMLYGMTTIGGANNLGVLFEYNIASNTIATKTNFNGTNGSRPNYTNLIEIQKLPSITSSVSTISNCLGNPLIVSYSITGVYNSGNVFTAQLSDSLGSFSNPINIGSLNSSSTGVINSTIPFGIPPSSYYKIRVISSDPIIYEANNTTNIFLANSTPTIFINGLNNICVGSNANLTAIGAYTYSWSNGSTNASISEHISTNTTYSVTGVNACGTSSTTVSVLVDNSCANVWPGDINNDGAADNLDVLELGLHYNQIGAPRNNLGVVWQAYNAPNWIGTISNGSNLNHSDCNGDGIINNIDTFAIYNNYALTHVFKPLQIDVVNPELSIVPDQAMVTKGNWGTASIYLGDATNTITNINGVAFTVDFDNTLIEPNSIWIEYQNSFIDASQNLYFRKLNFANGKLFTATTHTISNNVNGYGKIATLHYQIKSTLTIDDTLDISLVNANQSSSTGIISPLTSGSCSLTTLAVGIKENFMNRNISISPNPTNGLLNINFSSISQNTKIELYNSIGALVLTETMINKNNTINMSDLSNGIYFMKVLEGNKVVEVKKVVKE